MRLRVLVCMSLLAARAAAAARSIDPQIKGMVDAVSEERIAAIERKLESFGTRNVHTNTDSDTHGIGAASRWILAQLKSYSPRLEVRFDTHRVAKQSRIQKNIELTNVVAVLPGTTDKERQILVTGHYDTLIMPKRGEDAPSTDEAVKLEMAKWDQPSPGVTDDASGTAAVMELARVLSQHEFRKTLVFVAFAGEEMGLIGSSLYAEAARKADARIEAVLNNDIVGSEVAGNGWIDNGRVRVFSEDPADSSSRQLARYLREAGERYVPSMKVDMIFRADRFSRGGDHTPFNQQGYAAVRLTSAEENYANQHTTSDTFANTSPAYTARVARVNAAAAAALALSPSTPVVEEASQRAETKGRMMPMIARGKSGYDAVLRWKTASDSHAAGYVVVMRSTLAPDWEREIAVGDVNTFTLQNVSIDDAVFGVKAVDAEGHESLAAAYVFKPRPLRKIETW